MFDFTRAPRRLGVSLPRPDLEAHRNSLVLTMPELLRTLISNIGEKLTAFVAGVDHPEIISGVG